MKRTRQTNRTARPAAAVVTIEHLERLSAAELESELRAKLAEVEQAEARWTLTPAGWQAVVRHLRQAA